MNSNTLEPGNKFSLLFFLLQKHIDPHWCAYIKICKNFSGKAVNCIDIFRKALDQGAYNVTICLNPK